MENQEDGDWPLDDFEWFVRGLDVGAFDNANASYYEDWSVHGNDYTLRNNTVRQNFEIYNRVGVLAIFNKERCCTIARIRTRPN